MAQLRAAGLMDYPPPGSFNATITSYASAIQRSRSNASRRLFRIGEWAMEIRAVLYQPPNPLIAQG